MNFIRKNSKIFFFILSLLTNIFAQEVYRQYRLRLPVDPIHLCPENFKCSDGKPHFMCGQSDPSACDSESIEMTADLKRIFISGHNGIRNKVAEEWHIANMNLLHWSRELETMAKFYLKKCAVNSDYCMVIGREQLKVGQNYGLRAKLQANWPGLVVRAWYLEIGYSVTSFSDYEALYKVMPMTNFSQMIWPLSEFVGCGALLVKKSHHIIVCYYHPPFEPDNVTSAFRMGAPCSQCMQSRHVCSLDFLSLCGIDIEISLANKISQPFWIFLIPFLVGNKSIFKL